MRRTDREVTDQTAVMHIVENAKFLHLALADGEFPYVVPLHYGYELVDGALRFYMHCALEGHKLDLIRQNSHVGACLECDVVPVGEGDIACVYSSEYASVVIRGTASIVEDIDEKIHGLELLMQHQTGRDFTLDEDAASTVAIIRVDAIQTSAKARRPRHTS